MSKVPIFTNGSRTHGTFLIQLKISGKQGSHSGLENGRAFSSQKKTGNFDQAGKVGENLTKYWKTRGISDKCYFSVIFIK